MLAELGEPAAGSLFDGVLARGAVRGIFPDVSWLQAMLDAEAALSRAQADGGLLPAEYAEAIAAACRADDFDPAAIGIAAASSGNPVAPLVRLLTTNVRRAHGEPAAGWVHHGATSQDVADTATMLLVRDAIQVIVADVPHAPTAARSWPGNMSTHCSPAAPCCSRRCPLRSG